MVNENKLLGHILFISGIIFITIIAIFIKKSNEIISMIGFLLGLICIVFSNIHFIYDDLDKIKKRLMIE